MLDIQFEHFSGSQQPGKCCDRFQSLFVSSLNLLIIEYIISYLFFLNVAVEVFSIYQVVSTPSTIFFLNLSDRKFIGFIEADQDQEFSLSLDGMGFFTSVWFLSDF